MRIAVGGTSGQRARAACTGCGREAAITAHACACGGRIAIVYAIDALQNWRPDGRGLARYLPLLPVECLCAEMGEGETPLVESRRIGPTLGIRLYFKLESLNPTGSYKDRIASVGVALAAADRRNTVIATSSGNAGAAIAAFAARAGLTAVLLVPEQTPPAKLAQILAYGATVVSVRGALAGRDAVARMFNAVMRTSASHGWLPLITAFRYAPAAMEGVKTIAFEVVEALSGVPDSIWVPVGGGGLLAGVWSGFAQARALSWTDRLPRLMAVQPDGCAPVIAAVHNRPPSDGPVATAVSGLQVADPPDLDLVCRAIADSSGGGIAVADEAIFLAQRRLAVEEAIFAEPAGAAALAGLLACAEGGALPSGGTAVCLITGTGFKDARPFATLGPTASLDVGDLDRLGEIVASAIR